MGSIRDIVLEYGLLIFLFLMVMLLVLAGIKGKKISFKQICFNVAAVFFAFFIYELYLGLRAENVVRESFPMGFFCKDQVLGYRPCENIKASARKTVDGQPVYDVVYTIENGRRSTPNTNPHHQEFVLFLGGSFAFGTGLEDHQTLPYHYNEFASRRYAIRNYGFPGYGMHQVMAIVENRIIKDSSLARAERVQVYYLFIPDHIRRAAGKASWDNRGPHYEVDNEEVRYLGSFDREKPAFLNRSFFHKWHSIWRNSKFYQKHFQEVMQVEPSDIRRAVALLKKMNRVLTGANMEFNVILNSNGEKNWEGREEIKALLAAEKIPTFTVEEIISDFDLHPDQYIISPLDKHPNSLQNELVAKYLQRNQPEL